MICALCGDGFELGQRVIQINAKAVEWSWEQNNLVLVPALLADGSSDSFVHEKCVYVMDIPLVLIRADHNWRPDV